jgi:hypothetical protein
VSLTGFGAPKATFVHRACFRLQSTAKGGLFVSINLSDTRVSLDGYRLQVLERLKASGVPARARDILSEVDVMLNASALSRPAQKAFWEGLSRDLDVLSEDFMPLLGKEAAIAFSAVMAAARADIEQYLNLVSTSS